PYARARQSCPIVLLFFRQQPVVRARRAQFAAQHRIRGGVTGLTQRLAVQIAGAAQGEQNVACSRREARGQLIVAVSHVRRSILLRSVLRLRPAEACSIPSQSAPTRARGNSRAAFWSR